MHIYQYIYIYIHSKSEGGTPSIFSKVGVPPAVFLKKGGGVPSALPRKGRLHPFYLQKVEVAPHPTSNLP